MEDNIKALNDRVTIMENALLQHMKAQEEHWKADDRWKEAQTKELNALRAIKNKWGGIILGVSIAISALYGAFTMFNSLTKGG